MIACPVHPELLRHLVHRENLTFVLIAAKKIKFGFVSAFLTEILLEGETTHSEFMYNLYLSIISMFDLSNILKKVICATESPLGKLKGDCFKSNQQSIGESPP